MRIWSIHPKYLDNKGLVALWRETLLAKHVLEGKTKGYKNHPQLERFKNCNNAIGAIHVYLEHVYIEAFSRGYAFEKSKFRKIININSIPITNKQIEYEFQHLKNKLAIRDSKKLDAISTIITIELHPLFVEIIGDIAPWEIVKKLR